MEQCESGYFIKSLSIWFTIICIVILFISLSALVTFFGNKQYIIDNWVEYRCDPIIMPFASFFGKDSSHNLSQCLGVHFKTHKSSFLTPILSITSIISQTLKGITHSFNDLRNFMNVFRIFHLKFASGIVSRITDVGSTMQLLLVKIRAILERMVGILVTLIYTGFTAMKSIENVFTGPIGSMAKFFCFGDKTYITLISGLKKKISEIEVGDKIMGGGLVLGKLKFSSKNVEMFNYNNIIVSSTHVVYENGVWKRINGTNNAKRINYKKPYIFCLITQYNKININNCMFRDYIETSNYTINRKVKEIVLSNLNNRQINIRPTNLEKDYYLNGFGSNTLVVMNNKKKKKISEIKIGDILDNNNKVTGITKFFPINGICKYKGIYITPFQILYHNNQWKRVIDLKKNIHPIKYNQFIYNICTENNKLIIDNIIYCDYEEVANYESNMDIDQTIIHYLNLRKVKKRCKK